MKDGGRRGREFSNNFLEESLCGCRISMSGSNAKALCSKSASRDKSVYKNIGKIHHLSQEITLIQFKVQKPFLHSSKHFNEQQGETSRACSLLIAETLSSS